MSTIDEGGAGGIRGPEIPTGGIHAPADVPIPGDHPGVPGRTAEPDIRVPHPEAEPEVPGRVPDPEIPAPEEMPSPTRHAKGEPGAPEMLGEPSDYPIPRGSDR